MARPLSCFGNVDKVRAYRISSGKVGMSEGSARYSIARYGPRVSNWVFFATRQVTHSEFETVHIP